MRLKSLIVVVGGAMLYAVDEMPVALANHQAKPDFGGEIVYLILFMIGGGGGGQRRNLLGLE